MSEHGIAPSEPEEVDERLSLELRVLSTSARLRSRPTGDMRCEGCRYYLEPSAQLSYCWHHSLRILVGADWWCQWWEQAPPTAGEG
jgi:hypothetical protein